MEVKRTELDDLPKYTKMMRAHARKARIPDCDVDDIVSEALLVACKRERPRPPPEDRERVKAWLEELVDWQVLAYRQAITRQRVSVWHEPTQEARVADPRETLRHIEAHQWVGLALKHLPEKLAYIVVQHLGFGARIRELAREMGVADSTATVWLHRGEKQLREALEAVDRPRRLLAIPWLDIDALWRAIWQRFGRLGTSLASGCVVLFFPTSTPNGCRLDRAASEPRAVAVASPARESARIEGLICKVAPKAPVEAKTAPRTASPAKTERPSDSGFLTLVMANAALTQGKAEKAKALLDEDSEKRPEAQEKRERAILRAAADRK